MPNAQEGVSERNSASIVCVGQQVLLLPDRLHLQGISRVCKTPPICRRYSTSDHASDMHRRLSSEAALTCRYCTWCKVLCRVHMGRFSIAGKIVVRLLLLKLTSCFNFGAAIDLLHGNEIWLIADASVSVSPPSQQDGFGAILCRIPCISEATKVLRIRGACVRKRRRSVGPPSCPSEVELRHSPRQMRCPPHSDQICCPFA